MKTVYAASIVVAAVALLVLGGLARASQMDTDIETSAKQSYVFKTYLEGDDVKVQSKDGVVTLTGTVSEESRKSLAGETVAALPNVKKVENKIEVKGESPAERSDAWLKMKVKTSLFFHRSVSASTEVDVNDGVVTLRGEADSQAEKDLTAEYAKDVEGVKSVKNEMTVAKKTPKEKRTVGDKIDDASITALVKTALLTHKSTSGLKTSVQTKDGVVTLSGEAANAAEVALATKRASDVKGVKSVDNRMTVK
ncbi:MAG: BON domain-containing protein [Deferrisomatales bacterium]|nr:BON domain-containing protein [Deferrisomatales bacterium]